MGNYTISKVSFHCCFLFFLMKWHIIRLDVIWCFQTTTLWKSIDVALDKLQLASIAHLNGSSMSKMRRFKQLFRILAHSTRGSLQNKTPLEEQLIEDKLQQCNISCMIWEWQSGENHVTFVTWNFFWWLVQQLAWDTR